jgi:hypothetical protein
VLGSTATSQKGNPETGKKGIKRGKSPKSKSPVPAIPLPTPETPEGEESGEPVRLLKGHDTEVRHV